MANKFQSLMLMIFTLIGNSVDTVSSRQTNEEFLVNLAIDKMTVSRCSLIRLLLPSVTPKL